ncbi:class I SAM-dependent methyltransferase [Blastococcus aggregatus]|uniref:class I SAM-dependent methyltransferase n=1 Tax=Blastococcus aggregatus TaxID=38502 RepID=UPI00159712A7|nr:class I SAM-dependent methyltransferase [Blastococcus aggregatus]
MSESDASGLAAASYIRQWFDSAEVTSVGEGAECVTDQIAFLQDAAAGGAALEFGAGRGWLALQLAAAGIPTHALDLSPTCTAHIDSVAAAARLTNIRAVTADMRTYRSVDRYALVYCSFNTLFHLLTLEEQQDCFTSAAANLGEQGRFVVDCSRAGRPNREVTFFAATEAALTVQATGYDDRTGITTAYFATLEDSAPVRLRQIRLRYSSAAELDDMAQQAGLSLAARYADYRRRPWSPTADRHISVYGN